MTWILTASGADYHLTGTAILGPEARPILIEDIAHHLAIINRFTGATSRPYSVAEHSLLCCDIAQRAGAPAFVQLAALMHDAHEAYVSDASSPAKTAINGYSMAGGGVPAWTVFEIEHMKAVREHFNLRTAFAGYGGFIRELDLQALATERRDLTAYDPERCAGWPVLGEGGPTPIRPLDWAHLNTTYREHTTWQEWREDFKNRFHRLQAEVRASTTARSAC
ncbi:hypothetical protein [Variovorax paradoxus]|uniref:hypothetical protein n=1 Tax=Variovorax paradoxus TaxID=34073 RepID=UPI001931FD56|nr:hypothetical protein INQ48_25155 [Variovorax paradoxus]